MRIPSGVTDQVVYFVAVDATDLKTRETGLSSFTVYRSRNGGSATAFTTPTVTEVDATNMPGVYKLLLDEDMTIDSGDDSQEFCVHITHTGMAPVTRTFELYRPKITVGETIVVSGAAVASVLSVTTVTGNVGGNVSGSVGSVAGNISGSVGSVLGGINTAAGTITTLDALDTAQDSQHSTTQGRLPAALVSGRIDASVGAMASGVVTATAIASDAITAAKLASDVAPEIQSGLATAAALATAQADLDTITGADGAVLATSSITDDAMTTAAADEIATRVWAATTRQLTGTQSFNLTGDITGNLSGSVGSISGVTFPTNFVDLAITSSTGRVTVGTNADKTGYSISGTLTTLDALDTAQDTQHNTTQAAIVALNNLSAAQVNAEVDAALAEIHLDHLLATTYDPASKPGAADALLNELVESDSGVARFTANALEQGPGGAGSDPWNTALPGAYAAGTAGYILGTNLDAAISGVGGAVGSGAIGYTHTLTRSDTGAPVAGADVWVATDAAGANIVAGVLVTNSIGQVTFQLDAGAYYLFAQLAGYNFTNPTTITVSA